MKTLKTSLKTMALFFMALTLLQGCVAYQRTPVSLQEAEQSNKRVKMKTSSNQIYEFQQIVLEEEVFYGLKKERGDLVRIAISNYGTNEVFLPSKGKSAVATIGLAALPVGILVLIASTSDSNPQFDIGF